MKINIILFDNFETLDAFGPVEIFGKLPDFTLGYYSLKGGSVRSAQELKIDTLPLDEADPSAVFLLPGGMGTRSLIEDTVFLRKIKEIYESCEYFLTVCTGSALLAKSGAIDGERVTSNKKAMDWVKSASSEVQWINRARWVVSHKLYSSSGVSAGMDMTLGFISDLLGKEAALGVAKHIEYLWNEDAEKDDFADYYLNA